MTLLKLRHFHHTCAACGHYFETLETSGEYGGPVLYQTVEGERWYIDPDTDPVWQEVDALVTERTERRRGDVYFADVFHELLTYTIDHPLPGARFDSLRKGTPCPRCGVRKRASFGPFEPNRFSTVDVPPVTHRAWNALAPIAKRELTARVVRECAIDAITQAVYRESSALDDRDVEMLTLAVFHPDMVWPRPPHPAAHDPLEWVMPWGRYSEQRWRERWSGLFETQELVHNRRTIRRIEVADQGNGGFAVVDVDTLWRDRQGREVHWLGRSCKIYTLVQSRWLLIAQTGLLEYPE